ncbi:MAG: LysM peptidoglycan-binding domain-containing protein [Defluviitaleaceae bacterium]|nr:LysM peptidoglycan-binding domain-containing protein [Defluviitaleaceae bacterium]
MKGRIKEIKGFAIGVLFTVLISGTIVIASPVAQEIVFGVSVSFNGQPVDFEEDMRPFTIDGRTFLPVRAIAEMFMAEVDFDEETNTVLIRFDRFTMPAHPNAQASPQHFHTVQPGHTLVDIAQIFFPDDPDGWLRIAEANNLTPPYSVLPGHTLIIPDLDSDVARPYPNLFPTAPERTHTVQPGQTIAGIAQMYFPDDHDGWLRIAEANNLSQPYSIQVGQVLTIPD